MPALTLDLDVMLDPDPANLDGALALLHELEACLREHPLRKRLEPIRIGPGPRKARSS